MRSEEEREAGRAFGDMLRDKLETRRIKVEDLMKHRGEEEGPEEEAEREG